MREQELDVLSIVKFGDMFSVVMNQRSNEQRISL